MLIAIVGATGTGKSRLSLQIAALLAADGIGTEVVNADAMQLYRGMDIGTAKLRALDRQGVPHHLIDVLDITDDANVASYQKAARHAIADITSRGSIPILVGGSGLYVSSVLFPFTFPATDAGVRKRLEAELDRLGPEVLFTRLTTVDAAAAASIGPHNGRRIVRALEVIEITGEPFGAGLPDENVMWTPTRIIGVSEERTALTARLDRRVERMWSDGLVREVRSLLPYGLAESVTASRAIGYAQAIGQIEGTSTESEAIAQTQALTRKYARRQVGWFRRYPSVTWLESGHPGAAESAIATIKE